MDVPLDQPPGAASPYIGGAGHSVGRDLLVVTLSNWGRVDSHESTTRAVIGVTAGSNGAANQPTVPRWRGQELQTPRAVGHNPVAEIRRCSRENVYDDLVSTLAVELGGSRERHGWPLLVEPVDPAVHGNNDAPGPALIEGHGHPHRASEGRPMRPVHPPEGQSVRPTVTVKVSLFDA